MGVRTFIAVELPATTRHTLAAIRGTVTAADPGWNHSKWVAEENLHITLKFMGDLMPDRIVDVRGACDSVARSLPCFDIRIDRVVPSSRTSAARMLWAGVGEGVNGLTCLASRLEEALADAGFPRETRGYRPHITLVRARGSRPISPETIDSASDYLRQSRLATTTVSVQKVTVYSSTLTRQGPVYRIVHRSALMAD